MNEPTRQIAIVFSHISVKRLLILLDAGDVWVMNNKANAPVVDSVWSHRLQRPFNGELTTFESGGATLSVELASVLELIDEHETENAQFCPWQKLRIIGKLATNEAIQALSTGSNVRVRKLDDGILMERELEQVVD